MMIWIVLHMDNDILGVYSDVYSAIKCAKAKSNFNGWLELWELSGEQVEVDSYLKDSIENQGVEVR